MADCTIPGLALGTTEATTEAFTAATTVDILAVIMAVGDTTTIIRTITYPTVIIIATDAPLIPEEQPLVLLIG